MELYVRHLVRLFRLDRYGLVWIEQSPGPAHEYIANGTSVFSFTPHISYVRRRTRAHMLLFEFDLFSGLFSHSILFIFDCVDICIQTRVNLDLI